jgi:invasion protein IalB
MRKACYPLATVLPLALAMLAPTEQARTQIISATTNSTKFGVAGSEIVFRPPIKFAGLADDAKAISSGDLLHTTRVFRNWNLNCEVLLSQARHICSTELRAVDSQGRSLLSWTFALASDSTPIIIVRVPADINSSYGVLMLMGSETKFFTPTRADCASSECVQMAVLDDELRTMIASQRQVTFSFMRGKEIFRIDAPLKGLSDALEAARRDPIGLVAARRAAAHTPAKEKPEWSALARPSR